LLAAVTTGSPKSRVCRLLSAIHRRSRHTLAESFFIGTSFPGLSCTVLLLLLQCYLSCCSSTVFGAVSFTGVPVDHRLQLRQSRYPSAPCKFICLFVYLFNYLLLARYAHATCTVQHPHADAQVDAMVVYQLLPLHDLGA